MSAIEQITTLLESLSFAEKLTLNERIATAVRKEGGAKTGGKRGPKSKTDSDEPKPKRKAAIGTLAWTAYVKHIKTTQPDAFVGITKESDKLTIVKGIRSEDKDGYDSFVSAWKDEHKDDASADEAEVVVVPAPKPVSTPSPVVKTMTAAEKIAALKASKVSAVDATPAPKKAAPKKEVKEAAPKKEVKKAAPKKEVKKEETSQQLPQIVLEDVTYWHDPETNGLWKVEGETFSGESWTGYYQPGNEEEPIRYTENFGDE